ncbi:hypothetical protein B0O99DRAFT_695071 [Bisporella sp. PMI_857]|nr:hypothetical protein B0O99DRAFT_695071 [Bisporella sp. PMI_857]
MASTTFTPYWRIVGDIVQPCSWAFFVVAKIAGHHRPIAIVSSIGMPKADENMQGTPLIAACHRIITIFTDTANHLPIQAELSLAAARDTDPETRSESIDLLEFDRGNPSWAMRKKVWDRTAVREFPFTAACLLQGVSFDALEGLTREAFPETLSTVYRDTSSEWGMVVIDITDLDAVRYGIVSFASAQMKWAPSAEAVRQQSYMGLHMAFESGGEFRVVDKVRPRKVMSAVEYMAKNQETILLSSHYNIIELLAHIPLVDSTALEYIWPSDSGGEDLPPLGGMSVAVKAKLPEQAIRSLIQTTLDVETFDISIFDEVRTIPNFQEILWRSLLQNPARLGHTASAGQLIRLAFAEKEHIGLEQLGRLSVEALSAVFNVPEMQKVTSISLCIDAILNPSIELIDGLSRSDTLRDIYFLQSPTRERDVLSGQLFKALAAHPELLSRVKAMFAGAYSAALRKRFWLPTAPENAAKGLTNGVQVSPFEVFPIQQMLVRMPISTYYEPKYSHDLFHFGDGLLKPERFAAGFIVYVRSLIAASQMGYMNPEAQTFAFSSAPSSLSDDPLTSAEISPIMAESFATDDNCWPRMRDLVPGGWTVIVSSELYEKRSEPGIHLSFPDANYVRYAFVRPRKQSIAVYRPPTAAPGPDELEVVGLKEFLAITAPKVDPALVDRRWSELQEKLISRR